MSEKILTFYDHMIVIGFKLGAIMFLCAIVFLIYQAFFKSKE